MSAPTRGWRAWLRWEFGRRIEVTGFIKFIIVERFVKGSALIVGGVALLVLSNDGLVSQWAERLQQELILTPGRGFFHQLWTNTVVKFGNFSQGAQDAIAIAAFAYGALEALEGVGLLLRRRWAEYLVLVATLAFVPLEVAELASRFTVLKLLTFAVNVAIVVYLVVRKRLFLERPGDEPGADATTSAPNIHPPTTERA